MASTRAGRQLSGAQPRSAIRRSQAHLNHIIHLCVAANCRVAPAPPIYAGVGTNFYMVANQYSQQLWLLSHGSRLHRKSESVRTDTDAGVD